MAPYLNTQSSTQSPFVSLISTLLFGIYFRCAYKIPFAKMSHLSKKLPVVLRYIEMPTLVTLLDEQSLEASSLIIGIAHADQDFWNVVKLMLFRAITATETSSEVDVPV